MFFDAIKSSREEARMASDVSRSSSSSESDAGGEDGTCWNLTDDIFFERCLLLDLDGDSFGDDMIMIIF